MCVCDFVFTITVSLALFKLDFCIPLCMTIDCSASCKCMLNFTLSYPSCAELACRVVLNLWWTGLFLFLFVCFFNRQTFKRQCISNPSPPFILFFWFFPFSCSGIFAFLQDWMACCPYECLLQGWPGNMAALNSKWCQFLRQSIMNSILAITDL